MENPKNGKIWQIAFWLITVICGVWLLSLTTNVVAVDVNSRTRDEKIVETVNRQYNEIVQRLVRIETNQGRNENRK
jgi:hypothetical protein